MRAVKYRKSPVATLLERNWQAHKETSKRKVQRINGHSLIGEYLPARRRNARRKTRLGEKNRPRGGEKNPDPPSRRSRMHNFSGVRLFAVFL